MANRKPNKPIPPKWLAFLKDHKDKVKWYVDVADDIMNGKPIPPARAVKLAENVAKLLRTQTSTRAKPVMKLLKVLRKLEASAEEARGLIRDAHEVASMAPVTIRVNGQPRDLFLDELGKINGLLYPLRRDARVTWMLEAQLANLWEKADAGRGRPPIDYVQFIVGLLVHAVQPSHRYSFAQVKAFLAKHLPGRASDETVKKWVKGIN